MMYSTSTLAMLGLAAIGSAHMIMTTPVPFGKSTLNNSPLAADGSDFPCKQRSGVYTTEGASNTIAIGAPQPLKFQGSATHGGGSCQISVTYDSAPTKNSVWKVVHSIEGGCPIEGVAGNNGDSADAVDPSTYSFTLPSALPTGSAVLAWTWFNKIGNREMYMNCAPITITAGASKRDEDDFLTANATQLMERDTAAYNALPSMFTANIGNGCTSADSKDLIFPDPGDSLEYLGTATSTDLAKPTGTSCGAVVSGASDASPTGASSAPVASAPVASAPVASAPAASAPAASAPAASAPAASAPAASSQVASSPAVSSASPAVSGGGVFATVVPSATAYPAASSAAASSPLASSLVASTSVASANPVASSAAASSPIASASTPSSSTSPSPSTSGSGTAIAAGTACTTEGEWNCIAGTSFQQCASGAWSAVQQMAAGMTCTAGESAAISMQAIGSKRSLRSLRFSREHAHRRRHSEFSF